MKFAILFFLVSITIGYFIPTQDSIVVQALLANTVVAFLGVGVGYGFLGPKVFMKRHDGRLHPLTYVLFWPFLLLNWVNLFVFRAVVREHPYDEIVENLLLGFRLFGADEHQMRKLGILAALDVSSEFSEVRFLREGSDYRAIPVLDATPPTPAQLEQGVQWMRDKVVSGPTYVHCALGHARSATFVAAYLIASDRSLSVENAIAHVKNKRPGAGLHPGQIASLKAFVANRDGGAGVWGHVGA
jgi:hypothetical protein